MEGQIGSHAALSDGDDGSTGAYTLRELIKDVPLTAEGSSDGVYITCVDTWNGNLYIGTSAGELLHFVSIQSDPSDEGGQPTWIIASRLEPPFSAQQEPPDNGVKQILLLRAVGKACVLCNGTLTFYALPELSPAFGGKIKQSSCTWVGGLDGNADVDEKDSAGGTVIVICLRQRLRLIRIGDEARKIRDIELGGVSALQRRGDLACVADGNSYSLLDVVNQRKNDLFPTSSATEPERPAEQPVRAASRSFSSRSPVRLGRGHERNISLGAEPRGSDRLRPDSASMWPSRRSSKGVASPNAPSSREESPALSDRVPHAGAAEARKSSESVQPMQLLPANIVTPTPNEFLLTTGTQLSEPGVGMFVNLDGDVVRGTIEFSSYPRSLVFDGSDEDHAAAESSQGEQEGYVLALVQKRINGQMAKAVEITRWDLDPGQAHRSTHWLAIDAVDISRDDGQHVPAGLRSVSSIGELAVREVTSSLRLRRLKVDDDTDERSEAEGKRNAEEDRFAARFSQVRARVLLYTKDRVHWVVRNPLVTRLEKQLNQAVSTTEAGRLSLDGSRVQRVVNGIRAQDATNELDFLTLTYARQKASLLIFGSLLLQTADGVTAFERDKRAATEALTKGDIDPRLILALIPPLSEEVQEGEQGIWIPQGLRDTIDLLRSRLDPTELTQDARGAYGDNLLNVIKHYLFVWRNKKGFGSVADEKHVFQSVDAALLHVLLLQDQHSPRGPGIAGSVRGDLNEVVDRGLDCFDRAVELFEQFNRLYMLSRLYQSRKMVSQVLGTWRRIMEGDNDTGGELVEGEQDLRRYLTRLRDKPLVQEYGAWLANRNSKLGVQVFADDNSRVQFEPNEAVAILKEKAPSAVKDYLEHLVFGKNHIQYVNDLIAFYLDTVLSELEASSDAKKILLQSYETYRALRPPKPTYRQFITDNAIDAEWWHNRLRLLQLIGGSHGAASKYDVHSLGARLAPYSDELVPEMIILNGREGKHEEAIRLLTHGLGDYDTAIRYCLLGGSSIFHPGSGLLPDQPLPTKEEQARLFEYLLHEFLRIEDFSQRLERTAELLERFGGWFEVANVLELIPDEWSVELVSGFLAHAFRRLVRERNETVVVKALSSSQNLRESAEFIEKIKGMGPAVVGAEVDTG